MRRVGGLADTVVDADATALAEDRATGFVFDAAHPSALEAALARAVALYREPARWQPLMRRAMAQQYTWDAAAQQYLALYAEAIRARRETPRRIAWR